MYTNLSLSLSLSLYAYIYIYIYTYDKSLLVEGIPPEVQGGARQKVRRRRPVRPAAPGQGADRVRVVGQDEGADSLLVLSLN